MLRHPLLQGIGHPNIQGAVTSARENVDVIHARIITKLVAPANAGSTPLRRPGQVSAASVEPGPIRRGSSVQALRPDGFSTMDISGYGPLRSQGRRRG